MIEMKIGSTNNPLQFAVNYFAREWSAFGNCENSKIKMIEFISHAIEPSLLLNKIYIYFHAYFICLYSDCCWTGLKSAYLIMDDAISKVHLYADDLYTMRKKHLKRKKLYRLSLNQLIFCKFFTID